MMEVLKERRSVEREKGGWQADSAPSTSLSPRLEHLKKNWKVRLAILAMLSFALAVRCLGGISLSLPSEWSTHDLHAESKLTPP